MWGCSLSWMRYQFVDLKGHKFDLDLKIRFYQGSNDTDDPTEFEIMEAKLPNKKNFNINKLTDHKHIMEDIYEKFSEDEADTAAMEE